MKPMAIIKVVENCGINANGQLFQFKGCESETCNHVNHVAGKVWAPWPLDASGEPIATAIGRATIEELRKAL